MGYRIREWCRAPDEFLDDRIWLARLPEGIVVAWSYLQGTEYGCFVDPELRRQGIGGQLYRHAAQHFPTQVELCRHDPASRGFYEEMTRTQRTPSGWAMESVGTV